MHFQDFLNQKIHRVKINLKVKNHNSTFSKICFCRRLKNELILSPSKIFKAKALLWTVKCVFGTLQR